MPSSYIILDTSNNQVWEEQSGDGNWQPHDGTIRAASRYPTLDVAMQVCILYPAAAERRLRIAYVEDE